eukprot:10179292-Alexandrium_andersonii.AAC.1
MQGDSRKEEHAQRSDGCYFARHDERRNAFSSYSAWAPMSNGINNNVFWRVVVVVVAVGSMAGRLAPTQKDKQIYVRPGQLTLCLLYTSDAADDM